jgi:quinol monooxygenase YgiN
MIQMAVQLQEMDERVTFGEQLQQDTGPIVLINRFNVAPEDTESLMQAWAEDAAFMKQQPGYISTQLHRGIAGSTTFINIAIWESAQSLALAFGSP